jgi:alcohol dehydrogenase class IV
MREVGVTQDSIDGMSKSAVTNDRLMGNNIRALSEQDVKAIFQNAF